MSASASLSVWRLPFMSEADIPSRFGPAVRWVTAGIFLFVFALGISDSAYARNGIAAAVYAALFIVTFVIAVKWVQIADALTRWRQKVAWILIALGFCGALALGVAIGGLLLRGGPLTTVQSSGRIVWNFDQPGESFFLGITRLNDEEMRVVGFQAHGKNTSTDPISEFSGVMRSDRTNEQRPIFLLAQEATAKTDPNRPTFIRPPMIPTPPEETFGIPGLADFDIGTHDKPFVMNGVDGVPISQFLRDFGAFTIILKYDGATIERHFSVEQINAQVALLKKQSEPDTNAPRITRKPTATPVQTLPIPIAPELPLQNGQQPAPKG
jgi:hypothetical protein